MANSPLKSCAERVCQLFLLLPHAGVYNYSHTPRSTWIMECLGMVTLAGSQVWWTWDTEDSFRQVREGDKHAMKNYAAKLTKQLADLTGMVSCVVME